MLRRTTRVAATLAALSLGACGGSNTTTSPTASPSPTTPPVVTIVTNPPAPITASTDPAFQWATSFSLTLTESAGVAVNIRSVSANLQQASGGIVVTPPAGLAEAFRYEVKSSSSRLAANGTITIGFTFLYTLPQPGQEALVTVTLNLYDDSGNAYPQTVRVNVV